MSKPAEEDKMLRHTLKHMTMLDAIQGEEIYYFYGRRVVQHRTADGSVLAIKPVGVFPKEESDFDSVRSEAGMMHYAAVNGVEAPRVRGVYDIVTLWPKQPLAVAIVSERAAGERLADVWSGLTREQQEDLKTQLRQEMKRIRSCTQPYIGRLDKTPTRNVYDRILTTYCGPFEDEKAFDEWCLARVPVGFWGIQRKRWARWVERERERSKSSGRFVLTHCDLTPRNIIVRDGKITGIVDWERSGFFPEYAEYAFAIKLGHNIEKWWLPVLKEVLEPCCSKRLQLTSLVEDRGW